MNEQIYIYARKPAVLIALGGVVGAAVGFTSARLYARRDVLVKDTNLESVISDLKTEQLQLDFDRAAKDRAFNIAIEEAYLVTRELKELGMTALGNLRMDSVQQVDEDTVEVTLTEAPPTDDITLDIDENTIIYTRESSDDDVMVQPEIKNIFDGDDSWDYESERNNRSADKPYVIHVDEYVADELGYESQSTLTWYQADRILTDHRDVPIYDVAKTVGDLQFGHGSLDPNIVYVRNEVLKSEYEVLRDPGSYEVTVLGNAVERTYEQTDLKHSRSPMRFRDD